MSAPPPLDHALANVPEQRLATVAKLRFPFDRMPATDARDWDRDPHLADTVANASIPIAA